MYVLFSGPGLLTPWYPALAYFAIPFVIFYPARAILMSSKAVCKLLMRRRQVQVEAFFLLIWGALWVSVFFTSPVALVGIAFAITSVVDLLKDATVRRRSRAKVLTTRLALGVGHIITSSYLVAGAFGSSASLHYLDFRPDTAAERKQNATAALIGVYSDQPSVVDLYQQTADLGISLGIEYIVTTLVMFRSQRDALATVHVPVFPVFDNAD